MEKYITSEEAAQYLNISPTTLCKWIYDGRNIPAYKMGNQWRFKISELDEWIHSGMSLSPRAQGAKSKRTNRRMR